MALEDTNKVTVTLQRATVKELRSAKGNLTWDKHLLTLLRRNRQGSQVRCMMCGREEGTGDIRQSAVDLAEGLNWEPVKMDEAIIGFVCDACTVRAKESRLDIAEAVDGGRSE